MASRTIVLDLKHLRLGQEVKTCFTRWRVVGLTPELLTLRHAARGRKRKLVQREIHAREADLEALGTEKEPDLISHHKQCIVELNARLEALPVQSLLDDTVVLLVPAGRPVEVMEDQPDKLQSRRVRLLYVSTPSPVLEAVPDATLCLRSPGPWMLPVDWSGMDMTSDGLRYLYVAHDGMAVAAEFDVASGEMVRVVPTPAPLTRMQLDPRTGFMFGIQNYPPVLWKFKPGSERVLSAELSPKDDAVFGCLFLTPTRVHCFQSRDLEGRVRDGAGGGRKFLKRRLEPRELDDSMNEDGCYGKGRAWCGAHNGKRTLFFTYLTDHMLVPDDDYEDALVTCSATTPTRQVFCDAKHHTIISCSKETFCDWRRESVSDQESLGLATVGERVFVLNALGIHEVSTLVTFPKINH